MRINDLLLWRYRDDIDKERRIFLLKCENERCAQTGRIIQRVKTDGVGKGSQCRVCNFWKVNPVSVKDLSAQETVDCLLSPSLLSPQELDTDVEAYLGAHAGRISEAAKKLIETDVKAEAQYRAALVTRGQAALARYHAYIKPPSAKDAWMARAALFAMQIEGKALDQHQPALGTMAACTFADGSCQIGFSGDGSKASAYRGLLTTFLELFRGRYADVAIGFAMDSNQALVERYYQSFKEIKGGKAVQSEWQRFCAETKFLDLGMVKRRPMGSCTVFWIGKQGMDPNFSLFQGKTDFGAPMVPCPQCFALKSFFDEL